MAIIPNQQSAQDMGYMARALALANNGLYISNPNPTVGCVLVKDDTVIAEGWTQQAGGAHAEVHALQRAAEQGVDVRDATAYVSLEPCSFTGKTGPCSQALINSGVSRVVYAMEDPNPKVSGQGIAQLREAGVAIGGPLFDERAAQQNPGFVKRMTTGLPWIRLKMAMSLDGRTAMASGESKWITGPAARRDVQRLRARSDAIITGIGSLLQDNSFLNVRADELDLPNADAIAKRQPLRVILDSSARLPTDAQLFTVPGEILWVNAIAVSGEIIKRHQDAGNNIQALAITDDAGRIDLRKLLAHLAERDCNEVLVEAGATLTGEFVRQGLIDELIIYMAPKLLGSDARPLFSLPLQTMAAQLPLKVTDIRAVGKDWRITAKLDKEG